MSRVSTFADSSAERLSAIQEGQLRFGIFFNERCNRMSRHVSTYLLHPVISSCTERAKLEKFPVDEVMAGLGVFPRSYMEKVSHSLEENCPSIHNDVKYTVAKYIHMLYKQEGYILKFKEPKCDLVDFVKYVFEAACKHHNILSGGYTQIAKGWERERTTHDVIRIALDRLIHNVHVNLIPARDHVSDPDVVREELGLVSTAKPPPQPKTYTAAPRRTFDSRSEIVRTALPSHSRKSRYVSGTASVVSRRSTKSTGSNGGRSSFVRESSSEMVRPSDSASSVSPQRIQEMSRSFAKHSATASAASHTGSRAAALRPSTASREDDRLISIEELQLGSDAGVREMRIHPRATRSRSVVSRTSKQTRARPASPTPAVSDTVQETDSGIKFYVPSEDGR